MRISDWSSDVCSSDLHHQRACRRVDLLRQPAIRLLPKVKPRKWAAGSMATDVATRRVGARQQLLHRRVVDVDELVERLMRLGWPLKRVDNRNGRFFHPAPSVSDKGGDVAPCRGR